MNTADKHQLRICRETVKNPMKALMGGPSVNESKKTLKEKFGWSDIQIAKLEK